MAGGRAVCFLSGLLVLLLPGAVAVRAGGAKLGQPFLAGKIAFFALFF
jgi:hypothetical protein